MPREIRDAAPAMVPMPNSMRGLSFEPLLRAVTKYDIETKVITAWVVWLILRLLQSILGPRRRRSRHWFVQYGAMAAYYLPSVIAFYTANAVYSASDEYKVALSIGCAVLLLSCARGAVTMTAFTLGAHHGPQLRVQSWRLLPWLLYFAWLQFGSIWYGSRPTVSDVISVCILFVLPVFYVLLAKPRVSVLDYETKQFADYMMQASSSFFDADANSLYQGCGYPFMQLKDGRWINFSDVLQQRGRLPRDCADGDPADICLSYSFCRLLARRYFGFPCAEGENPQVRDFVLKELLLPDYNRVFSMVEVQLALLHDYFFTNYHSDIKTGSVSVTTWMLKLSWYSVLFLASSSVSFLINNGYKQIHLAIVSLCVVAVPAVLLYIVIVQPQSPLLPRYWHPIQNLFLYYPTATTTTGSPSGPASVIDESAAATRSEMRSRLYYWRDKLSQYSVMEDYDHRSSTKTIIAWCKVRVLSQVSYSFIKHHPAERKEVRVPDSVRRLVARTIKGLNGSPAIGTRVLLEGVDDLSWTFRRDTLTHTILIWHIGTYYCGMFQTEPPAAESKVDHEIGTVLSKYCAYLVAFLPELLPDHALTAKVVLHQVLQEPRDLLGRTRIPMEAKKTRVQELQLQEDEYSTTTFQKGVWLGRQLEQQPDVSLRWKAMADFWAEMILYLASFDPSGAAHVEQLAQGGEFLTHLWALLCNAGILNEARQERNPQQPINGTVQRAELLEHDAPAPQPEEKSTTAFYRRTKSATT